MSNVSSNQLRIGLALSGGGSRAMAFHLGCLRALENANILGRVATLSTISGGSVIGSYFAYNPHKSFKDFELDIRQFLRQGFLWDATLQLLNPIKLLACMGSSGIAHMSEIVTWLTGKEPLLPRFYTRTDLLQHVLERNLYKGLRLSSPRRHNMSVVIGACDLRQGTAFRFGDQCSGSWRRGVLANNDLALALAVTTSAAYPLFLPAIDRTWKFIKNHSETEQRVCLTDGGVYDNLGVQVLEPYRDSAFSIHNYPCDYIIACNAGHGQDIGAEIPLGFYRRVNRSFNIIHRRVQDATMNRLHHLKSTGAIKGFIMPYLGQMDDRVKLEDPNISREKVISYPTNFSAMSEEWIDRLSARGEQLTQYLLGEYMPELL